MPCPPGLAKDEMGRICSAHREKRSAYRILAGKLKDKRPGGPRCRLEDNIKMDL
jgi:hypothetical protein